MAQKKGMSEIDVVKQSLDDYIRIFKPEGTPEEIVDQYCKRYRSTASMKNVLIAYLHRKAGQA